MPTTPDNPFARPAALSGGAGLADEVSPAPPAPGVSPPSSGPVRPASLEHLTGGRFALFADCLLVGVLTAVAALGLVTAFPALAAACSVLRERVARDTSVGVRRFARTLLQVLRTGPAGLLVPPLILAVLYVDVRALAAGAPGTGPLAVLLAAAASAAIVLGLRTAAGWRPGDRWPVVAARAARQALRDPGGSALLWLAGVVSVAIVLIVPITVLLVAGPLALAATAIDGRTPR